MCDKTKSVGRLIYNRRTELGLTQREVADYVGVSEATVSRWESGDIDNMRRDRIAKLSAVLRISPLDIMGIEPSPSPAPAQPVTRGDMLMLTDKREISHIQKYRALDERGKDNVDATLEHEYEYASPEARAEKQSG